jgi:hypothetical protein
MDPPDALVRVPEPSDHEAWTPRPPLCKRVNTGHLTASRTGSGCVAVHVDLQPHSRGMTDRCRRAIWLGLGADVGLVTADAGWSSSVARWAHNPEVTGSNPVPATTKHLVRARLL